MCILTSIHTLCMIMLFGSKEYRLDIRTISQYTHTHKWTVSLCSLKRKYTNCTCARIQMFHWTNWLYSDVDSKRLLTMWCHEYNTHTHRQHPLLWRYSRTVSYAYFIVYASRMRLCACLGMIFAAPLILFCLRTSFMTCVY